MKRYGGWIFLLMMVTGASLAAASWTAIPRHWTRTGIAGGFELRRFETTVAEFVRYLNDVQPDGFPETAQIARTRGGRHIPRRGCARQAVAEVTFSEAEDYCRWLSRKTGDIVRLPTETEWEIAARGGVDGAPFPWGWGGDPSQWACFDASGPARRGGLFPANGFGLYDMAGNLFEWCRPAGGGAPPDKVVARGGSWAERSVSMLAIRRRCLFAEDYRGRDVGFRPLREIQTP